MNTVSLVNTSAYLNESSIPPAYYAAFAGTDDLRVNLQLRAQEYCQPVAKAGTNVHMVDQAAGGEVAHQHGMGAEWIVDAHDGSRAAFMLRPNALVSCAGRFFEHPGIGKKLTAAIGSVSVVKSTVDTLKKIFHGGYGTGTKCAGRQSKVER